MSAVFYVTECVLHLDHFSAQANSLILHNQRVFCHDLFGLHLLVSNIGASVSVCFSVDMLSLLTVLLMAEFDLTLTFSAAFALRFGTKWSI